MGTALRELKGSVWQEAALLLAEAYHELGDQKTMLDVLHELKQTHPTDPNLQELVEELELEARSWLGLLDPQEAARVVHQFISSFRNRHTHAGRARAALGSARMARDLGDMKLFDDLQEALDRLPIDAFEPREKGPRV